ncbi:extensin-like [Lingula anatina]|uniref:Extensin-like n=1 Tax=Lingula anatina TaxID=7574 RepID=A0A1S3I097_LINAN|nr:extensin-like [Lingula anatina]|eukprot:XP_013391246.1 extensin-like [Lingula anatina]
MADQVKLWLHYVFFLVLIQIQGTEGCYSLYYNCWYSLWYFWVCIFIVIAVVIGICGGVARKRHLARQRITVTTTPVAPQSNVVMSVTNTHNVQSHMVQPPPYQAYQPPPAYQPPKSNYPPPGMGAYPPPGGCYPAGGGMDPAYPPPGPQYSQPYASTGIGQPSYGYAFP